nr:hypothetical protein [Tanacetum cinerariifolium]
MALISVLEGPTRRDFMDHELAGLADHPGMRFSIPHIKVSIWIFFTSRILNVVTFGEFIIHLLVCHHHGFGHI